MGIAIKSIPNESLEDFNIRLALHILATDYNINGKIETGLSNGKEYKYVRFYYWKQLPKEAYYIVNHLIRESEFEDDDTKIKYSYHPKKTLT